MPETTAEDDFGKFFDQLSDLAATNTPIPRDFGAAPAVAAVETPAVVEVEPTVTAVPATTATESSAATGTDDATAAAAKATPVVESAAATPPADTTPALLERFVQAMEAQKPAPQPQRQQPAPQLYTQEELTTLETFEKDWPDAAKALQLIMRGASTVQSAQMMQQMAATLAPALQNMETVQVDHQLNALRQAIPDYDAIRDESIQWATTDKKIPPLLRDTYNRVIAQGTPSDVKWLVEEWRTATGKSVSTTSTPATIAKPANELSEAAKQAAASLAPVVSKRTAVVSAAIPSDFDGAFEHFAAVKR